MIISNNRIFALVWRIAGLIVGVTGSAIMFTTSMGKSMIIYFTMQTNLFIVAMFCVLTVLTAVQIARDGTKGEAAHLNCSFQLALTFYITITFVVYWTMLSWQNFQMSGSSSGAALNAANYIVHGVVPIFAIIDWIVFLPHGRTARSAAFAWLLYPAIYAVFIFVRVPVPLHRRRYNRRMGGGGGTRYGGGVLRFGTSFRFCRRANSLPPIPFRPRLRKKKSVRLTLSRAKPHSSALSATSQMRFRKLGAFPRVFVLHLI